MKFSKVFEFIKMLLVDLDVKRITWWNGQSGDNLLMSLPAVFVEFPSALSTRKQGSYETAPLRIRVLLIEKLLSLPDGSINETIIERHELLNKEIYNRLQGQSFEFTGEETTAINSLLRTEYELNMNQAGLVVSRHEFVCEAFFK